MWYHARRYGIWFHGHFSRNNMAVFCLQEEEAYQNPTKTVSAKRWFTTETTNHKLVIIGSANKIHKLSSTGNICRNQKNFFRSVSSYQV